MTKTIEMQIDKSRSLIQGLRKHLSETGSGTTLQELDAMEQAIAALVSASEECDRIRAELAPKMQHLNVLLDKVRTDYVEHKLIIKNNYPKERWIVYGLLDKR
jgi:hypothetical protein